MKNFWFSLINNDSAAVAKIDQHTVKKLEMMALCVKAKVMHSLVLSGQIFADFDENERIAIWENLQSFNGLILSLYSFFKDFKCFKS